MLTPMIQEPRRAQSIVRKVLAITAAAVVLAAVGLAAALFTTGVPDTVDLWREHRTLAMLSTRPTMVGLRAWLDASHASWHRGRAFKDGEAYSAFVLEDCKRACGASLQVAFTHRIWLCEVTGDVVTVTFDRYGRVESSKVVASVDGC